MNVARFNFSHGTHAAHQEVLDRVMQVGSGLARLMREAGVVASEARFIPSAQPLVGSLTDVPAPRFVQVSRAKHRRVALLLDTKGPEVRTAMVRGGKDIELEAGQEVILVAVGDAYDTWEGYKDEASGELRVVVLRAKFGRGARPPVRA